MINYVVGFAFSKDRQRVVLIKKNGKSVPEHKGLLNGVGGKVDPREIPAAAMSREFKEETGVFIPYTCWRHIGVVCGEGWDMQVFRTFTDEIMYVRSMESEEVRVVNVHHLPLMHDNGALCPHVKMLVDLCLNERVGGFRIYEEV